MCQKYDYDITSLHTAVKRTIILLSENEIAQWQENKTFLLRCKNPVLHPRIDCFSKSGSAVNWVRGFVELREARDHAPRNDKATRLPATPQSKSLMRVIVFVAATFVARPKQLGLPARICCPQTCCSILRPLAGIAIWQCQPHLPHNTISEGDVGETTGWTANLDQLNQLYLTTLKDLPSFQLFCCASLPA